MPPPKPVARAQSARVVGLPDSMRTTERDHRIKIQFPWQRGKGILISATARPNGPSTQMDAAEAVAQLKAAEETAKALSDAAAAQNAAPLKANAELSTLIAAVDPKKQGKFTVNARRQPAQKAQAARR